jgi:hypothetical protein
MLLYSECNVFRAFSIPHFRRFAAPKANDQSGGGGTPMQFFS